MRLSDYRLKFAELIGPWTTDPSNKKNEIWAKLDAGVHFGGKGLNHQNDVPQQKKRHDFSLLKCFNWLFLYIYLNNPNRI